jgi:hypothetical protein
MRYTITRLAAAGLPLVVVWGVTQPLQAQADSARAMAHDAMSQEAMGHEAMAMSRGPHGSFTPVGGHTVSGGFEIVTENGKQVLRLTRDFSLGKAPDAAVVLSRTGGVDQQAVHLGRAGSVASGATFAIPAGTDLASFSRVVIWSNKRKVALADAPLTTGEGAMQPDATKH